MVNKLPLYGPYLVLAGSRNPVQYGPFTLVVARRFVRRHAKGVPYFSLKAGRFVAGPRTFKIVKVA